MRFDRLLTAVSVFLLGSLHGRHNVSPAQQHLPQHI